MKVSSNFIVISIALSLCFMSSCKNMAKKGGREMEKVASKTISKKVSKPIAKEMSKGQLSRITQKELMAMKWSDLNESMVKNYPELMKSFSSLNSGTRKALQKSLCDDYRFYRAFTSSDNILKDCKSFTKDAPKLMKDPDFIRMYVKSTAVPNKTNRSFIDNLVVKEQKGVVDFYTKGESPTLIAESKGGIVNVFDKTFIDQELLPNACYKIMGKNGEKCVLNIDNLGRISTVKAQNMSPDEIMSEIMNVSGNNDFGQEWDVAFKKLRETSKGGDININCKFTYPNTGDVSPKYVHVDADIKGKKQIAASFENTIRRNANIYTAIENSAILKKYATSLGLSSEKSSQLLSEMNKDNGLANLIHSNPTLNIKRWINTRNHVDEKAILRLPSGRLPANARVYSGNIYYMHPSLNSGLQARLERGGGVIKLKSGGTLSYNDLVRLDEMYPEGVPFTKGGFPDFTNVSAKSTDGKPIKVNIGKFSGDSQADISKAETMFQEMGNPYVSGFTWHHIENSSEMLRVPTIIHQLVDHAGGASMARK